MKLLTGSLFTFVVGVLLTLLVRRLARSQGIVAQPRPDRWHQKPTALCGGVAIYLAFLAGCLLFAPPVPGSRLILAGGGLLFLMGLFDDLLQIRPHVKLVIQLAVAAVVVFFGRRLPWTDYQGINIAITIFFLVGITNAINLLDNMDGLAGGVTVIACEFLSLTLLLNGQTEAAFVPALLGGAVLGFLLFNFNPASIFMGDCGSMFLGFSLGATALLSEFDRTRNLFAVLLTPVLILLIPIFDTCLVTVSRKLSGRAISQGGRDHASHRLVALGVSERRAVLLLYALAALSGLLALLVRGLQPQVLFWLIPGSALAILFLGIYLGKVRVYEEGEQPLGKTILRTLENFTYKRRFFEIVLDVMLVALAYYGAFLLRFDGGMNETQVGIFLYSLPLVIALQMVLFLLSGVYQGLWRFISFDDLLVILKSVFFGAVACAGVSVALFGWQDISPAVLVLYPLLLVVLISLSRYSFRLLRRLINEPAPRHPEAQPVLIYGAGEEGLFLLRQILENPEHRFDPIGFVDDDFRITGKRLSGYRIYDGDEIPSLMHSHGVKEILVSSIKVPESKLRALRNQGLITKRIGLRFEPDAEFVVPQTGMIG
jgi:UDP-GlcNAc:undecaprenyl-phosphate/decaprenyl-phosphate GlcNAc-1-phosphate transferase